MSMITPTLRVNAETFVRTILPHATVAVRADQFETIAFEVEVNLRTVANISEQQLAAAEFHIVQATVDRQARQLRAMLLDEVDGVAREDAEKWTTRLAKVREVYEAAEHQPLSATNHALLLGRLREALLS